jgi:NAD(P)H-quinone oxidoreductase subunit 5
MFGFRYQNDNFKAFYRIVPNRHLAGHAPAHLAVAALIAPILATVLAPMLLMVAAALLAGCVRQEGTAWNAFRALSAAALLAALGSLAVALWGASAATAATVPGLASSLPGAWMAALVQLLGTVIGAFSSRYLQGEAGQTRYVAALAAVLAAVHLLLLADHWLVLIAAWSAAGLALQRLLCFYADRPFALLAAHKKQIADRVADVLLLAAAVLAWSDVGSGSLAELRQHVAAAGEASVALQASAVCLVLAVILRTALFPVHGWLIQVMEAPTPVSALLHAGVVNLGGFVLIRLVPLLEASPLARGLLVAFGLTTAALAGLVMLTRVSIKVRLAWSTVAQMGFMLLECGLGLYTLAFLHLVGHSLYKAHTFLASSSAVRQSRLQALRGHRAPGAPSLVLAPLVAMPIVVVIGVAVTWALPSSASWPWWWNAILALAWAPLLWLPSANIETLRTRALQAASGAMLLVLLTALANLAHAVPLGVTDAPGTSAGLLALVGMAALYTCLALLQARPHALSAWRRWSYAGFYVDEAYTRLALRLWPTDWASSAAQAAHSR